MHRFLTRFAGPGSTAFLCLVALSLIEASPVAAQSLTMNTRSMDIQNLEARKHGYSLIYRPDEIPSYVADGRLVKMYNTPNYQLKEVSFPYARPEVRDFVDLLGSQYKSACGEQLVVTSLTRPVTRQPRNASKRSVHPTGMALDLRRSWTRKCRTWLEQTLLTLEDSGVLEASLEWNPAHYHLALFPRQYREFGAGILATGKRSYVRVARGDTLWRIASRHKTSIQAVKQANGLRSNVIYAGQVLKLPSTP